MNPRRGLLVLWGSAAIFAAVAVAAMVNYASRMAESMSGQGVYSQIDWQWANAVNILVSPFSTASLLAILIALVAHATLWRRDNLTPQVPQESSR